MLYNTKYHYVTFYAIYSIMQHGIWQCILVPNIAAMDIKLDICKISLFLTCQILGYITH